MHTLSFPQVVKLWLGLAALLCIGIWPAAAWATPLMLRDSDAAVDAWPAVSVMADATHRMTWQDAQASQSLFSVPSGPRANLGVRRDTMWLRMTVEVPRSEDGQWVLEIDYPGLDHVDLYVLADKTLLRQVRMGRLLRPSERPMQTRAHAVELSLPPGHSYELLIRIETASTVIAPLRMVKRDVFYAQEGRNELLQGVMAGVGLCLVFYSLIEWISLRDSLFLRYALVMIGTVLFFFAHFGMGVHHVWGRWEWMSANASPFTALIGMTGAFLFVERALRVAEFSRKLAWLLNGGAMVTATVASALALGLIDYRTAHQSATLLGAMPMLLAISLALSRARAGDRVAAYMLFGWGVYLAGTLVMVGMLRGLIGVNIWTQYSFQLASICEMLVWMRVLAVRVEDVRASAQRAHIERDTLRGLAHSDPLTGLFNRRGLTEALDDALRTSSSQHLLAVYLIDLDGFKTINDELGHEAGDKLLIGVARRLESLLRSSDRVARLGGDEFVVMVSGLAQEAEAQVLGIKLLQGFDAPFDVDGRECRVGMTVGYAMAPLDAMAPDSLLRMADAAMYEGKKAGRHCLRRGNVARGSDLSDDTAREAKPQKLQA